MEQREFFIPLPDDVMFRVRYVKSRGRILRFVVQLETLEDDSWTPVTRYDNAHQFVHRDDLRPDDSQIKSPPMAFATNEDAFNFALHDLRVNHNLYVERYRQWKRK